MTTKLKYRKLLLPLISLTFLVSSCDQEDLTAVEQFGEISAVIRQSSSNIVQDIYSSCIRGREKYSQRLAISPIRSAPDAKFPPAMAREECQRYIPVRDTTNQWNTVLIDYVESLGRLASNNTVSFNQNLQTLGNSLGDFGKVLSGSGANVSLAPEQIQQSTNVANSLLTLWSQQFRRDNLKQVLICTDDPYFQNYTSLLIVAIKEIYLNQNLQLEEDEINKYFNSAFIEARSNYQNDADKLASQVATLTQNYTQQIKEIDQRREVANNYLQLLEKTKQTHQALANRFKGQMSPEEKISFCKGYFFPTVDKSAQSKDNAQVSSPKQLLKRNEEELIQVQEMFKGYFKDIQPLVKAMKNKS